MNYTKYAHVFFVLFILIILCLTPFLCKSNGDETFKQASIIINGKLIHSKAEVHDGYVVLPLTEVLKGIGCTINYTNRNKAEVFCKDKLFVLNSKKLTLKENGSSTNLLRPVPGSSFFVCKKFESDVLMDDVSLKGLTYDIGVLVDIQFCSDKGIVYITS